MRPTQIMNPLLLGVETGGTKIVARLTGDGVEATMRRPTTTPDEALADILAFVRGHLPADRQIAALGVAAFGPVVLDGADAGRLLQTPKSHWSNVNLAKALADQLDCPFAIDTDVNAAARAEHAHRKDIPTLAYVTIGTGIGGGLSMPGGTLRGAMHPEIGHIRLIRAVDDKVPSTCPFHQDCAEGLAAGPAVRLRLGDAARLEERDDVRERIADYLAQLLVTLALSWAPHRIVFGGGIGTIPAVLSDVRRAFREALEYGLSDATRQTDFIQSPILADAGLAGALLMARTIAAAKGS
jgi:fructokinase